MFLNRDFCMEKVLASAVTIFPENFKVQIVYLHCEKKQPLNVQKASQNLKLINDVWITPLPTRNPY